MPSTWMYVAGATAVAGAGAVYTVMTSRYSPEISGMLRKGPSQALKLKLVSKNALGDDSVYFKFALPDENERLGLPVGNFMVFNHKNIRRPYTPISSPDLKGFTELAVKVYHPNEKFPKGGVMSQALDKLEIGSEINAFGPMGNFFYTGPPGNFVINRGCYGYEKHVFKEVYFVAGGSGITPIFQTINAVLAQDDSVRITLVYANKTVDSIMLKKQIDDMVEKYPNNLKVHYVITREDGKPLPAQGGDASSKNMIYHKLDETILKKLTEGGANRADAIVGVCGPRDMVQKTCLPALKSVGYALSGIFVF